MASLISPVIHTKKMIHTFKKNLRKFNNIFSINKITKLLRLVYIV